MSEDTQTTMPAAASPRSEVLKLWQMFLAAVLAHALFLVALSPGLFRKDTSSPDALLAMARGLVEEKKYEEALEIYQRILLQKPPAPATFTDAEKEMREIRLKALEAKKKAADASRIAEAGGEEKKPAAEKPGEKKPPGEPVKPPEKPEVELPVLPEIGG